MTPRPAKSLQVPRAVTRTTLFHSPHATALVHADAAADIKRTADTNEAAPVANGSGPGNFPSFAELEAAMVEKRRTLAAEFIRQDGFYCAPSNQVPTRHLPATSTHACGRRIGPDPPDGSSSRHITLAHNQVPTEDILSDDFVFMGPIVGPLAKTDYLGTVGVFRVYDAFPDMRVRASDFSQDPIDSDRFWATIHVDGTNTGAPLDLGTATVPPTGKKMVAGPQAVSVTFDKDDKICKLTGGYVVDNRQVHIAAYPMTTAPWPHTAIRAYVRGGSAAPPISNPTPVPLTPRRGACDRTRTVRTARCSR